MINGISLLLTLVAAVCAYLWMPLASFIGIKEGLIAYLGFLSAAVIQVIPVTANFLQGDDLKPEETRRLNSQLERQQIYWIGLLGATVFCLVLVICISAIDPSSLTRGGSWLRWERFLSGFVALTLSFIFTRMMGIFSGVLSLHRLRASLILAASVKRAQAKTTTEATSASSMRPILPPGYGEAVESKPIL